MWSIIFLEVYDKINNMSIETITRQAHAAKDGAVFLVVDMFARPAFLAPQIVAHTLLHPKSFSEVRGWRITNWRHEPAKPDIK